MTLLKIVVGFINDFHSNQTKVISLMEYKLDIHFQDTSLSPTVN